jgi:threonyl-tRNA synthetase
VEGRTLSVRTRAGEDLGTMELPKLFAFLREEVASRGHSV